MSFEQNKHIRVLIAYGSQLGNTEEIAHILFDKLVIKDKFIKELNELDPVELDDYDYVIIMCSTTGDGDVPDNASRFWRKLKRYQHQLPQVKYILIGFGDTNFNSFCGGSKKIHRELRRLGCQMTCQPVFIDDAIENGTNIEKWIDDTIHFIHSAEKKVQSWFMKSISSYIF